MLLRVCLVLTAACFLAADTPKEEKKDDKAKEAAVKKEAQKFQGDYSLTFCEIDGSNVPDDQLKTGKLTIKGDKGVVQFNNFELTWTFTVDPSKDPKTIDLKDDKGNTFLGIYEMNDEGYRICRTFLPGKDRPKDFGTKAESGRVLGQWKRVKP